MIKICIWLFIITKQYEEGKPHLIIYAVFKKKNEFSL